MKSDDALRAIESVNNITIDGRLIKSSLGTTKYCSHFMKNQPCPKPEYETPRRASPRSRCTPASTRSTRRSCTTTWWSGPRTPVRVPALAERRRPSRGCPYPPQCPTPNRLPRIMRGGGTLSSSVSSSSSSTSSGSGKENWPQLNVEKDKKEKEKGKKGKGKGDGGCRREKKESSCSGSKNDGRTEKSKKGRPIYPVLLEIITNTILLFLGDPDLHRIAPIYTDLHDLHRLSWSAPKNGDPILSESSYRFGNSCNRFHAPEYVMKDTKYGSSSFLESSGKTGRARIALGIVVIDSLHPKI
ncbi:hypothetical protein NQ317_009406 [Molorchus minor]|uniref:RRM domain-containing protein n=1 Tax=Molorchus minor TaxID=1323400 RepID=A0ABQ9JRD1_9CUCU|nr:hypothetical protein NQ317_009406 [Molorchus minor]